MHSLEFFFFFLCKINAKTYKNSFCSNYLQREKKKSKHWLKKTKRWITRKDDVKKYTQYVYKFGRAKLAWKSMVAIAKRVCYSQLLECKKERKYFWSSELVVTIILNTHLHSHIYCRCFRFIHLLTHPVKLPAILNSIAFWTNSCAFFYLLFFPFILYPTDRPTARALAKRLQS